MTLVVDFPDRASPVSSHAIPSGDTTAAEPTQGVFGRDALAPVFDNLKTYAATTHLVEADGTVETISHEVTRFNSRKATDGSRFLAVARAVVGKRLTYKELIGADLPASQTA